jgi:UDP-N-acetylmuramate dehydrogenase
LDDALDLIAAEARARGIPAEKDFPLAQKTSFKIGGNAACALVPHSAEQLCDCLRLCGAHGEKPFILGGGSNLLVRDSGLGGIVIATEGLDQLELLDGGLLLAQAGVRLSQLCRFALAHSLSGLEFAYGIPGSVGGAVFMNAGAYGGEMKDVLQSVQYADARGQLTERLAADCAFAYRHSMFMEECGGAVLCAALRLKPGVQAEIKQRMEETLRRRKEKQPLEFPSAGSVFKRPPGQFAGALIEQCGLKGKQIGGAQVSEKHAGFIINRGGATAADVRALIAVVQTVVEARTGFFLEPEIKFV